MIGYALSDISLWLMFFYLLEKMQSSFKKITISVLINNLKY